jgi:hypothetical protein
VSRADREGVNRLAVVAVVALVVAAGVAAVVTGLGPAPGGESGDEITDFPTATATPGGGDVSVAEAPSNGTGDATPPGTATATATPEPRPAFVTTVESVADCGRTCRDVTSTTANDGRADATGVTVYTRIFVGQAASGDVVWQGREAVGRLSAGDSYTATRRVELSLAEAAAVENAGGWITVQTTVQSDQRTVTFAESRQVA